MKIKLTSAFLTLCTIFFLNSCSKKVPMVFKSEHTGMTYAKPTLPSYSDLPSIRPLTDPFAWSDGSGRSTKYKDWAKRRAEINAEIQHYEIGEKPGKPDALTATFTDDTLLTVNVTVGGNTLTLTSKIMLPSGDGPFPAVIGVGRGSGSLPADLFSDRNIATIGYNFGQVMSHTQSRGSEPINKLYPDLTYMGAYSAWSWGVSRLIDGLEKVAPQMKLDLSHLAVTGCSFAGKMALFAGAFDERIALTIAQESGGGGAAAWRVSETLGNVEVLGSTSNAWFIEDVFRFSNQVPKLPYDHHELMALVAPRALLVLGNPDYEWLADESGYVSCTAAHEVWKAFGVADRFGYSIVDGHGHCQLPDVQRPEVEAFIDKFMLGKKEANTDVQIHPYESVDNRKWFDWWDSGNPNFAEPDKSNIKSVFIEAECGNNGSKWEKVSDGQASNGTYTTVMAGQNSTEGPNMADDAMINLEFNLEEGGEYFLFARLNCASADDDSFYTKIDDGEFGVNNGLRTNGWEWVSLGKRTLTGGDHSIAITYREDGAKIDKLCVTNYVYGPEGLGETASNDCNP